MPINNYKVVIVGAGVAGLYAAWRLCVDASEFTGLQPSDILIIEGSGQTGGRLFTKPLEDFSQAGSFPDNSGLRAELGGMRFLNYHLYVGYLARKLGLDYVAFPADAPGNWHFLRGTAMQSNLSGAGTSFANQTVYALAPEEQHLMETSSSSPLSPGVIISSALSAVVPSEWLPQPQGQPTLRSMVNNILAASWQNVPLWKMGFWNLVVGNGQNQDSTPEVSNQAYEFFVDAGAYDTVPANWNASTAVSIMAADFATDPVYYALTEGYQALCDALVGQLSGVTIRENSPVVAINAIAPLGKNYQITCAGNLVAATADNVILALPPRALQLITPTSVPLKNIKDQLLQSSPVPLFKIFLVYRHAGDEPWWSGYLPEGIGSLAQFTRMTTDLPMRQVYNFGTFTDGSGMTYSLLQASYSDSLKAGYWAGLLTSEPNQSIDTGIFGNVSPTSGNSNLDSGYAGWTDGSDVTEHPLFSTVHSQFVALLQAVAAANGITNPPSVVAPVAGAAIDWATDPFGGGVNFWNVGVDVNTAYNETLNPIPMTGQVKGTFGTGGVFIVGEGYSLMQGWVEGALWSVEDALAKAYPGSWPSPTWIPPDNQPIPPPGS